MARFDKIGIGVSTVCAIHCLATPFILLLFPALTVMPDDKLIHEFFLCLVVIIGGLAFLRGFRTHSLIGPPLLGFVGFATVLYGLYTLEPHVHHAAHHHGYEIDSIETLIGSAVLVWAHIWNMKVCKDCHICCDDTCGHKTPAQTESA